MTKPKTYTETIFEATAPWDNVYQGRDKKILFICSAGILRSATAARIYAKKYNTRAAGSHSYALIPVSANLLAWADEYVFVNDENYLETCRYWDLDQFDKTIRVLNIPDCHNHMDPELIKEFERQYEPLE